MTVNEKVLRALQNAPVEDALPGDRESIAKAVEEFERGESVSNDQLKRFLRPKSGVDAEVTCV